MIDFDLEVKKIRPINIKEMELNRFRINDNIRKSIILYNKAIAEVKVKNVDLAIKDLKKALSYNKGFSEAMKLLGLCYVDKKEYKSAEKTFKKLGDYAIYSDLSKEYIRGLEAERTLSKTMKAIRKARTGSDNEKKLSFSTASFRGKIVVALSVFIIAIVGFTITYRFRFISKPQTAPAKVEVGTKIADSNEKINESSEQNKILSEKNTISYNDSKNDDKKLDTSKVSQDNIKSQYEILAMLNESETAYKNGDYEKAAGILTTMKNLNFDDETKIKFDKLWSDIKAKALWSIYNEGNKLYKQKKYQEALPKLKLASEMDPSGDIMPWIIYQIATCYKETNDNASALVFFQKVKNDYPKSKYALNSEAIINQIGNKKENVVH